MQPLNQINEDFQNPVTNAKSLKTVAGQKWKTKSMMWKRSTYLKTTIKNYWIIRETQFQKLVIYQDVLMVVLIGHVFPVNSC